MLKQAYSVTFTPLPVSSDDTVYFDKSSVYLPCTDDFQTLHYHDRYEIGICEDGEGVFLFEDGVSCVSKDDVIFIAPGSRHYSRSLSKDKPCFCRFVYVDVKAMKKLMSLVCKDEENADYILKNAEKFISPIISSSSHPKESALLSDLIDVCRVGNSDLSALTQLRLALFILEAHNSFTKSPSSADGKLKLDNTISSIAEYISINYEQNNSIEDLAGMCNLSESQLRRRFARVYGVPPITYRNQLRCRIAASLLAKTQMSVSEISSHVGYSDISDFYRAFKKNYGMAPSAYRAEAQK